MIPRTLSASSLQVAEACLARWTSEYFNRAQGVRGDGAAEVGTAVHGALELFVKACYLERSHQPSLELIVDLYKMSYLQTFASADMDNDQFRDGLELTKKWYERTSFEGFTVLSAERKDTFPIKTSAGEIPFNYIWDRCDDLGDGVIRVVDYKTIRLPISAMGLKEKIQPRCYGLAAQIQFPEATRIKVEFDLLRYDRVGVVFSREDNAATWRFLKNSAERLIGTDENDPPEHLNPECKYCVRKASCKALKTNILQGGIFSVQDVNAAVKRRAEIQAAKDGLQVLQDELDTMILTHAEKEQIIEWETGEHKVNIAVKGQRNVDTSRAARVLGPDLMAQYGKLTLKDIDALLKGDDLTEEQKTELRGMIGRTYGAPYVKVSPASPIGD